MWNLSAIFNVVPLLIQAFMPLRDFVPRLVLAAILTGGGIFALFESVYLADQTAAFGSARIAGWFRAFRVIAFVLFGCSAAIVMM